MFKINEDKSIYATRGDTIAFELTATSEGEAYQFRQGDKVRITVTDKKDCDNVVLRKDFEVASDGAAVDIQLGGEETKFGEVISKPKDYWYEIELNPDTYPQTMIGYDEDGPKIFRLYPEGVRIE